MGATGETSTSPFNNNNIIRDAITDSTNGTPRTASETRPKNVAVIFCQYSGGNGSNASGANQIIQNSSSVTVTDAATSGTIAMVTSGAERMRIDSSGNTGIGTASPAAKLDVAGEVKFGNTASTCNATNEGQQRYNSTSKQMEFCNATSWMAFGSFRTSCPAGFTLIGTSGTAEAFCISTIEQTAAVWGTAADACTNLSPSAHLCDAAEWVTACYASSPPTGMTGNWEWVSTPASCANQRQLCKPELCRGNGEQLVFQH